jgi:A/G-specific adenine glycosylase
MQFEKENIKFFQKNILTWYSKNGRKFPWRKNSASNYERIISEVLLQRTKAETVSKFFPIFVKKYPSWKKLAMASRKELEKTLKPIGLYKQRSIRLYAFAQEMKKRNGKFPRQREEIEKIPFVGQYIANAIELFVFNRPRPLLDVNMARVLERFFGKRKLADIRYDPYLQELACLVVKHKKSKEINWGILDFGNSICKSRITLCKKCFSIKQCEYFINYSFIFSDL